MYENDGWFFQFLVNLTKKRKRKLTRHYTKQSHDISEIGSTHCAFDGNKNPCCRHLTLCKLKVRWVIQFQPAFKLILHIPYCNLEQAWYLGLEHSCFCKKKCLYRHDYCNFFWRARHLLHVRNDFFWKLIKFNSFFYFENDFTFRLL